MSDHGQSQQRGSITEVRASAHMMTLDDGVFCMFRSPNTTAEDAHGFPGVRIVVAPAAASNAEAIVEIGGFDGDGWLAAQDDAVLVRVQQGPACILVTVYQSQAGGEAPRLQVIRLSDLAGGGQAAATRLPTPPAAIPAPYPAIAHPAAAPPAAPQAGGYPQTSAILPNAAAPGAAAAAEVGAHIHLQGDVAVALGQWIGERGSRRWIEGFAIAPQSRIAAADIEYQAVLGRGWLSPWAEGGQFCGSRGMALPILGLRVKLRGAAAEAFECITYASFTDGSTAGPARDGQACEAESLSPLEAFVIELRPRMPGVTPAPQAAARSPRVGTAKAPRRSPVKR